MRHLLDSIEVFYDHLSAVDFRWIAMALALHFARSLAISRAWRNVIADAYPEEKVRWRSIWGAGRKQSSWPRRSWLIRPRCSRACRRSW